ncbi:centrosomal protein of 170 kDa protein B isoform X2 [Cololabis saira]|uniref:centrosomal protein of 170 kDa protein B isoform X2 n=1 Tax=Cololabis saira TaxID=129043 RepID=UPI002AD4B6B9|nr:centrosomal protein of 170 kDa protein B isoform X2 [Cololabis saira]
MSVTSWFLVSSSGTRHRLPREMIFVGRDDCELMLQSRSVDKQHAVINYESNTDEHTVKDLGSLNGTFVNDLRIPEQTYISLKLSDVIRFGYDAHVYILEKSQHKVPEEALKHEKYTSQLQLGIKALEAKTKEKQQLHGSEKSRDSVSSVKHQDRTERRAQSLTAVTDSPISKPTPLYGQPSWWGEDDDPAKTKLNKSGKMSEPESPEPGKDEPSYEANGSLSESQAKSMYSYRREPSYFEIPTKEFQQRPTKKPESQVHEVPTKDTSDPIQCVPSTPTPPVVQSHASFTIEFDDYTPGKMKIKDHVTKFAFRRRQSSTDVPTTPTEVMSAENKVADWLVQSNATMLRRKSQGEDMYSISSDPSVLQNTKANHRKDGSRSDSGHQPHSGKDLEQSESLTRSQVSPQTMRASPPQRFSTMDFEEPHSPADSQSLSSHGKSEPHQAFVIEFVEDNPRKKRSQSFTNGNAPPEPPGPWAQQEKAMKSSSPTVERQVPSASSNTPPTQRYTIPLKGPASSGFQRSGSLRKEKTEDRISTNFSSRSSSSASVRPFSSVGRRSKITQEFNAELLRQQKTPSGLEKNTSPPPKAAQKDTVVYSQSEHSPISPPQSDGHHQPQTSSPAHQPLEAPVTPQTPQSVDVKSPRNEEEDSLSDAGTYTIEADVQDKELEEARSKIDQVFGVLDNPERTYLSEAETSSAISPVVVEGSEGNRQSSCGKQGHSLVQSEVPALQGAPKYMSCWASLADTYTESGSGLFDKPSQMELLGGARGTTIYKATLARRNESLDGDGSKSQRITPQEDGSNNPTPSIHVHYNPNATFDMEDSSSTAPRSQDGVYRLTVQDDVEPDSLSDASKSDDASIIEQISRRPSNAEEEQNEDKPRLTVKSTSFYIGSEEESKPQHGSLRPNTPKLERKRVNRTFSTTTLTKQKGVQHSGKVKPTASAPVLALKTQSSEGSEAAVPLIRQESFTKDKPSNAKLPHISSQPNLRDSGLSQGGSSQDTHSYLKQTEDVLAVLEAKLQEGQSETTPSPVMDSLSGDSDVDTSSTVSQNSNKTKPNMLMKNTNYSGIQRERSSASMASQDPNQQPEKKAEPVKRHAGLRRSVGRCGSTDLSDDPQSLPYSDQESSNYHTRRKYTMPLQKEEGKTSRTSQALSRANSLSAPRPTRASMLRRARLGEASDNEGTETDRPSQDVVGTHAKQPSEAKKLSRLDMLAMPRKRAGSFNTPSDSEASSTPQWTGKSTGFSNRSTELGGSSGQRISTAGTKPTDRPQKAPLGKTTVTRGRSGSAKYAGSTANEEYDSNRSNLKHKRSQPSSASHSQDRSQPVVARHPTPRSRDSEEENHEGETFHSWSSHSAEIARLSQDLAKDLAILAREIHDVAGDGDPKTQEVELSAAASTATGHKQLAPHSSEAALNQPNVVPRREPGQSSSNHEQNSREQAQSRDEATVDSLTLKPVYQVINAISENTEQLGDKIKVLFQDKMDIWEETETKINSERDFPIVKASNKEIARILKELQRVQRQLEVINTVIEPRGTPTSSSSSSGVQSSKHPSSRDWRTVHSVSRRGGGPRPSESVRRAAVTPDDLRKGYLV